ncbi:hypothetical protein GGF39_001430 [Coemansia sp. RSA 1721]|nr:hypothetical protein GGF39_001430 [Coemansia sp. RSA 1721]
MHFIVKGLFLAWLVLISTAVSAAAAAVGGNTKLVIRVSRDSTVVQSTNKTAPCYGQPTSSKGQAKTLVADSRADRKSRILLGFDIPQTVKAPRLITNCTLIVPMPEESPTSDYSLAAYVASNRQWSEKTVGCGTPLNATTKLGSIRIKKNEVPGDIDVTKACQTA